MPILALLMLAPQDTTAILDKVRAALSRPFSVEFTLNRKDVANQASGKIVIQRPTRMKFTVKWGTDDYESWWSEDRTIDFCRSRKIFYESGPFERLYQPASDFSELPEVSFPMVILAGDPRHGDPAVPSYVASEKVGSVVCDHIKTRTYDAWIASDGRIMRFRFEAPSGTTTVTSTYEFKNWAFNLKLPKSFFQAEPPSGYTMDGLPRSPWPLQANTPFPERDWTGNIEFGKPFMAVVVAADCEASSKATRALATLQKDVAVWLFSDDGKVPTAMRAFKVARDKGGRTSDRLFAPGTPLFMLVGKDKRVKKLWFGFEPTSEDAFIREVRAELAK
jgi:hypothetical protein